MSIPFEVENKFRVDDITELKHRLQRRFGNVEFSEPVTESDSFFQHPCRDFVQTDECLRMRKRQFSDGTTEHSLTYKGPKTDVRTKTRQELEIPITEPQHWESLLVALGFRSWAFVQKFRQRMQLTVNNRRIEIVLDTLPALPESNRLFLEVETLAVAEDVEACRTLILDLAGQLELGAPVQDSYLKMVQNHGQNQFDSCVTGGVECQIAPDQVKDK